MFTNPNTFPILIDVCFWKILGSFYPIWTIFDNFQQPRQGGFGLEWRGEGRSTNICWQWSHGQWRTNCSRWQSESCDSSVMLQYAHHGNNPSREEEILQLAGFQLWNNVKLQLQLGSHYPSAGWSRHPMSYKYINSILENIPKDYSLVSGCS